MNRIANLFIRSSTMVLVLVVLAQPSLVRASDSPIVPPLGLPEEFGGYSTTHILIRLAAGLGPTAAANGGVSIDGGAIDALLQSWDATGVEPVFKVQPRDYALAERYNLNRVYRVLVPRGSDTPAMAAQFAAAPGIVSAEIDGIGGIADTIPNDPMFNLQWNFHNTGEDGGTPGADVNGPGAWMQYTGSASVLLAMIDTGIQANHPDLSGKVVPGWNIFDNNGNTDDPHGHGSHTACIAGALSNNSVGVAGMNWNVRLLAIRVTSVTGSGNESQCASGILYAVDNPANPANVISMSLQYYTGATVLRDAVAYAYDRGVLPIAASGNARGPIVSYPGKWPKCMAVGATTRNDVIWPQSNHGPEVDLSAPGESVTSCWRQSGYSTISGTSMATPHVGGLAASLRSWNLSLSNARIEQILTQSSHDLPPVGWDEYFGWGRLDASAALALAAKGDMNCDNRTDNFDIDAFVLAISDTLAYEMAYPGCDVLRADIDGDGMANNFDVDPFVELLSQ